jgi:hypothetical protein
VETSDTRQRDDALDRGSANAIAGGSFESFAGLEAYLAERMHMAMPVCTAQRTRPRRCRRANLGDPAFPLFEPDAAVTDWLGTAQPASRRPKSLGTAGAIRPPHD